MANSLKITQAPTLVRTFDICERLCAFEPKNHEHYEPPHVFYFFLTHDTPLHDGISLFWQFQRLKFPVPKGLKSVISPPRSTTDNS